MLLFIVAHTRILHKTFSKHRYDEKPKLNGTKRNESNRNKTIDVCFRFLYVALVALVTLFTSSVRSFFL